MFGIRLDSGGQTVFSRHGNIANMKPEAVPEILHDCRGRGVGHRSGRGLGRTIEKAAKLGADVALTTSTRRGPRQYGESPSLTGLPKACRAQPLRRAQLPSPAISARKDIEDFVARSKSTRADLDPGQFAGAISAPRAQGPPQCARHFAETMAVCQRNSSEPC